MRGTDIAIVIKAARFAADKHRQQRRKDVDASPYINHPIAVADLLANECGVTDPVALCAALLHDTIEDTDTTEQELRQAFGDEITGVVLEVTDDKTLAKKLRKQLQIEHARHASPCARLVKLADKTCNLRDMATAPPADWSAQRKADYFDWAGEVVAGLRGSHPKLDALFDDAWRLKEFV